MTERDDSAEGFLQRWSRKKIEGAPAPSDDGAAPAAKDPSEAAAPPRPPAADPAQRRPEAEFDLTSLPSLDSIVAGTDVRAFLAPGVPLELTRAALRRAWSADPAIRDFVGLAENAWDFTDPNAMPGFGELPAGADIKKLLAQVFGERDEPVPAEGPPPQTIQAAVEEAPQAKTQSTRAEPEQTQAILEPERTRLVHQQRDNDSVNERITSADEPETPASPRTHGGALPH